MRTLISISELTPDELDGLVRRTVAVAANGPKDERLSGRLVAICSDRPAQPACLAAWSAARQIGAHAVVCGPSGLPLGADPTARAGARILGECLDALVVALDTGIDAIFGLRADEDLAVITAHSNEEAPVQAVADLSALSEHFGPLAGRHVLCIGASVTGASLILAGARVPGVTMTLLAPPDEPMAETVAQLTSAFGTVRRAGSADEVDGPVDVVHVGRGSLDPAFVARVCAPDAVLLHDRSLGGALCPRADAPAGSDAPAGTEAPELDGIHCLCARHARHALAAMIAVLEWCVTGPENCR